MLAGIDCFSFVYDDEDGVAAAIDFCFDIELPPHFEPANVDGEVAEFHLLSVPEVSKDFICMSSRP
ncbi:unnamed protein product [Dibothriocephalus latus]|uniref:Uncharacterized protein n=1 Tax=Dibothriocephalus latus TaxID=60516 RepID=A0A3P6PPF0_DIBLA|nr:unnamed protein product [Dibothriocephalus latus]